MKLSKVGQVTLIATAALVVASVFTACTPITIDFLYAAGGQSSPGSLETFEVDRVTGALSTVGSTVATEGMPISIVPAPNGQSLYVANQDVSTIQTFAIVANGQPATPKSTSLAGTGNTPVAIALNVPGSLLYVLNQFQPGCTTAVTGAATCNGGALAVFQVNSSGTIGAPVANGSLNYWPVGVNPTAVNPTTDGTDVFVTSYDPNVGLGYIYSYQVATSGALSTVSGSPYQAGVRPTGVTSAPTNRFVYVTDFAQNQLIGYSIISGGRLVPLINGPFRTGNQPSAITIDPRGIFVYVTNQLDNTVSAYELNLQNGTPAASINVAGSPVNSTGTLPVAVTVDSGFGRYVISANKLDNSLSSFQLQPSTGNLSPVAGGPFPSISHPVALATIPRGNHSIQTIQP